MKIEQIQLNNKDTTPLEHLANCPPSLAMLFASPDYFTDPVFLDTLRRILPGTQLVGCSTAGEISARGVADHTAVISAIHFEQAQYRCAHVMVEDLEDSESAGRRLAEALAAPDLKAVFILGPGVNVNGSGIIAGLTSVLDKSVLLTGGLAGDGGAFRQTWQLHGDACSDRLLVGVGFYGDALSISHGSYGGWQSFGPARLATRVEGNVLYELDGEPALDLYKRYLGDYARDLPASGLLFPFAILDDGRSESGLIRTLLGIDEAAGSLILAGDVPPDSYLRLMHASNDALVDGAETAAEAAGFIYRNHHQGLALLVSCVGRKLVMGDQVDEEVEAVGSVFGKNCTLAGFYSHGEISPFLDSPECKLHNQTMTITCLSEKQAA